MEKFNQKVEDWLATVCESPKTETAYRANWTIFERFCLEKGKNASMLVDDYRATKYQQEMEKDVFLEGWQDTIRSFQVFTKRKYASLTDKQMRVIVKSFLKYWKIPLDVDLPKHPYVTYHNRDITKQEVLQILTNASPRDRVIYLVMVESGLRTDTIRKLKWWQIKKDFEAKRTPMQILLPSSELKDHVGDRWTFIGDDGFRELSRYLTGRLPLNDNDFVFASEKQGLVKGEQFSTASLTTKFNRIVQKLNIDSSNGGKPKKIRLHGLRKYFRNNMKADSSFIEFWMGHSLGVDAHYISRDVEEHRKRYAEGYNYLRVYEGNVDDLQELRQQLHEKDKTINELREQVDALAKAVNLIKDLPAISKYIEEAARKVVEEPEVVESIKKEKEKLKSFRAKIENSER
jgi:integrase